MVWQRAETRELRSFLERNAPALAGTRSLSDHARLLLADSPEAQGDVVAFVWRADEQDTSAETAAFLGTGHQEAELVAVSESAMKQAIEAVNPLIRSAQIAELSLWVRGFDLGDLPPGWLLERSVEFHTRSAYEIPVAPPKRPIPFRHFEVGHDETAWLAANADAFRNHPDQAKMDLTDLTAREQEPWFDPEGFLLAVEGEILGFCWTKLTFEPAHLEASTDATSDGASATVCDGEIYVIGVIESVQALGLGRALVTTALNSLWKRGAERWSLYVEADNTAAKRLYEDLGFQRTAVQHKYRISL